MAKTSRRKTLTITDAVISGQEEGPLKPSPIKSGFIIASKNFVANDLVATRIMGFDYKKIPIFRYALDSKNNLISTDKELSNIIIKSHQYGILNFCQLREYYKMKFIPSSGWKNHVELID
ncbi:unnamed protein product [marine sediment metagenome]|uniref:DUF362 domain-containing protein n=1 Tax=marine sediment metagenome TaxID=412755 RepID=X1RF20_9ZZZZ